MNDELTVYSSLTSV